MRKDFLFKLTVCCLFFVFMVGCSNNPSKDKVREIQSKYEETYNTYTDLTQELIDKGVFQDNPLLAVEYQEMGINFEEAGKVMAGLETATSDEVNELVTSLNNISAALSDYSKYVE